MNRAVSMNGSIYTKINETKTRKHTIADELSSDPVVYRRAALCLICSNRLLISRRLEDVVVAPTAPPLGCGAPRLCWGAVCKSNLLQYRLLQVFFLFEFYLNAIRRISAVQSVGCWS